MSTPATEPPPLPPALPARPAAKVLRRLFLTLFLRGRAHRGPQNAAMPKSVGQKLALMLFLYALFGLLALAFSRQPVFALAVYLHGMTFVFLGMFVAGSAGEILFNKEEADILLHRPIRPRELLWAKIRVLVEICLWLALALNLAGLFVGVGARGGSWMFPVAHALSTALEALFCTGCVVLVYQLCLRWFGRERLDGLMTLAQVLVSVSAVLAGQIAPRLIRRLEGQSFLGPDAWWAIFVPPAWFAGLDDALAGSSAPSSWMLAGLGLAATAIVLLLAFGRLAQSYHTGLQALGETSSPLRPREGKRRLLDQLVALPPLKWWLSDPVTRASFTLSCAYLLRDRDVKLRVYPGLAPLFIMPIILLVQEHGRRSGSGGMGGFSIAFAGCYLGLSLYCGQQMLQFSQQWQASDIFRIVPIEGPARLTKGARRAVLLIMLPPLLLVFGLLGWLSGGDVSRLLLLMPGILVAPLFALMASTRGKGIPLFYPPENTKAADQVVVMIGILIGASILGGLATWAWSGNWFGWLLLVEAAAVIPAYFILRASLATAKWPAFG